MICAVGVDDAGRGHVLGLREWATIDNGHAALRDRVRRLKSGRSGTMAVRWTAAALQAISAKSRRITERADLRVLKAALDESGKDGLLPVDLRPDNVRSRRGRQRHFRLIVGHHRNRRYRGVIKRKLLKWMKKRAELRDQPQPTKPFRGAVDLLI